MNIDIGIQRLPSPDDVQIAYTRVTGQCILTWNKITNTNKQVFYNIYRGISYSGIFYKQNTQPIFLNRYVDNSLSKNPNITYWYSKKGLDYIAIINKDIQYIISTKFKSKFIQLNYNINNNSILINQIDLYNIFPNSSNIKLECICDQCNKKFMISCQKLTRSQGKSTVAQEAKEYQDNLTLCCNCRRIKTNQLRFSANSPLQNNGIKNKMFNTNLQRYGAKAVAQNNNIKQKIKYTKQNESPEKKKLHNKRISDALLNRSPEDKIISAQKRQQTNLNRYGVNWPQQSEIIHSKSIKTIQQHYGSQYKYALQVPEINTNMQLKARQTMYKNDTCITSNIQYYLYNLLRTNEINENNIYLNYPFSKYSLDIALLNEKIDIEYNGGGHNLSVKLNNLTEEQFLRKENRRDAFIIHHHWKILKIISNTDKWYYRKQLTEYQIIFLINLCRAYLINTKYTWIFINIDNDYIIFNHYIEKISNILR